MECFAARACKLLHQCTSADACTRRLSHATTDAHCQQPLKLEPWLALDWPRVGLSWPKLFLEGIDVGIDVSIEKNWVRMARPGPEGLDDLTGPD